MDYVRKRHKNSNDRSCHHQEEYAGQTLVQTTSSLPTTHSHPRPRTHRAAHPPEAPARCRRPPGGDLQQRGGVRGHQRSGGAPIPRPTAPSPPPPPRLTSLPRCHSRCWAGGKPAAASTRAFTSPTAAEGGSSKVLQPRQSWRTVTRASLRQQDTHRLKRDAQTPCPGAHPPRLPARTPPQAPRRPGMGAGARPSTAMGRRLPVPLSRVGEKEPPGLRAELLPHRRAPAVPPPAPPPLTCLPRHTKDR